MVEDGAKDKCGLCVLVLSKRCANLGAIVKQQ